MEGSMGEESPHVVRYSKNFIDVHLVRSASCEVPCFPRAPRDALLTKSTGGDDGQGRQAHAPRQDLPRQLRKDAAGQTEEEEQEEVTKCRHGSWVRRHA